MSDMVELNSAEEFSAAVSASPRVLVELWGTHCQPCRALRPLLDKMATERDDWSFTALNVDKVDGIADAHNVRGTPTILLFKDGKEVGRTTGFVMPADLKDRLDAI